MDVIIRKINVSSHVRMNQLKQLVITFVTFWNYVRLEWGILFYSLLFFDIQRDIQILQQFNKVFYCGVKLNFVFFIYIHNHLIIFCFLEYSCQHKNTIFVLKQIRDSLFQSQICGTIVQELRFRISQILHSKLVII